MDRTPRNRRTALRNALGALLVGLAAWLLPTARAAAQAQITFTSAAANWHSALDNTPGSQPGDPAITNGVPTSSISWGTTSGPQSGYDVTITIPNPQTFPAATFSHRNFPVSDPSLTSVELDIVLDFLVNGAQTGPLTFTFTFTHEETPNNQNPCPYPTPPGQGCTDRVTFIDAPAPTTFTVGGKTYTLSMTFLDAAGNPVTEFITSEGGLVNTADLHGQFTLVPPVLEVAKSGPATLTVGQSGIFTIDVRNSGPNDAWNTTIRDVLPDGPTGGMCDTGPQVLSAQVFAADGVTPVPGKGPLVAGSDFALSWAGAPSCELSLAMLTPAAAIDTDERLIVTYLSRLDANSQDGALLTNIAGATEWLDDEISNPQRVTYTRTLTDGTPGVLDHEDAHDVTVDLQGYLFEKTVRNVTTGTSPATQASPSDRLRYQLRIQNTGTAPLDDLALRDELDRLNTPPVFAPGTLTVVTAPGGADASNTNPMGGAAGTGVLDVRNLSVAPGAVAVVEFEVVLAPVIANGSYATNQSQLEAVGAPFALSDDPGVNGAADPFVAGDEDPTRVLIDSAPSFRVEKNSADVNGAPLLPGETLHYTITVKNVGTADAVDATLRDAIPANAAYVAGSTTLNGAAVPDGAGGVAPLVQGIAIHSQQNPTPGSMPADASAVATLTFDVVVDAGAVNGTVISNQAFVSAAQGGVSDTPSDDPRTAAPNDPTRDVVGSAPILFAPKSAALRIDAGTPGVVDPGDVLHYTISIQNSGGVAATGVVLTDAVPANTTYVADSTTLNGLPVGQPDAGVAPLVSGIPIRSSDLTPPLPGAGQGTINPGQSAALEFDLQVNAGVPGGTLITNQATVTSIEIPNLLTDGDGNPATGPEPTVVVVGAGQQLTITKQVAVVGGGPALAGSQLEYVVLVRNVSFVPAQSVVITDDLAAASPGALAYVAGSASLNGSATGVSFAGSVITADYSTSYGPLAPGTSAVLRFRATLDPALAMGTRVTNTGVVTWNGTQTASASVSIDVGGIVGVGILSGSAWHDADFDKQLGAGERALQGWSVELTRNGQPVQTVLTDANGAYRIAGVAPNAPTNDSYALRFRAPGAGATTASLGTSDSVYTNGPQQISDILVMSGANLTGLSLPIDPNGVVYDALLRAPIAGAALTLLNAGAGAPLPSACFDDPVQQGQVTLGDGFYKFDLNFSDAACPSGGSYVIAVAAPGSGFTAGYSQIIPPFSSAAAPFSVPACPGTPADALPATAQHCEPQLSELAPPQSIPARSAGTTYHVHLALDDTRVPGSSQIFNNHIPLDPVLTGAVMLTKSTPSVNVSRGQLVPYEIVVANQLGAPLADLSLVDRFPAGFSYVEGSARLDGAPSEPTRIGRELLWQNVGIDASSRRTLALLLAVGAGVGEGEFVNRAQAFSSLTGAALAPESSARVRVVPDPTFDCTDVLGKVFDDADRDGVQRRGERGLPGVRVVTARGLVALTDKHGRFHITCAVTPHESRGSNFVVKLDDRTLPSGYRMSTPARLVKRASSGKALRFSFGASIHHVVGLDVADAVFEPDSVEMREHWKPRMGLLLQELRKRPAILRLSYLADLESAGLVERRVDALKREIERAWGGGRASTHDRDRGVLAARRARSGGRRERRNTEVRRLAVAASLRRRRPAAAPRSAAGRRGGAASAERRAAQAVVAGPRGAAAAGGRPARAAPGC